MTAVASNFVPIQQESIQYNQPVSEAATSAIAGLANGLFSVFFPVGSIVDSMLTEVQFQAQIGNPTPATWVLANGRSVTGSTYADITGSTNIPDFRGLFRRGKNNGRVDGKQNPDGDLALGTYTADQISSHTHTYQIAGPFITVGSGNTWSPAFPGATVNTGATGGSQTAPANLTINTFIRIN